MARKISFFSQKNSRRAGQSASWIFFSSTHINVVKTTFFPRIVKEGREIRILIRLSSKVISLWQREDSQQKIKEGRGIRILVFFYSPPFPSPDISIWQGELPAKYQEGYGGPHRGPSILPTASYPKGISMLIPDRDPDLEYFLCPDPDPGSRNMIHNPVPA